MEKKVTIASVELFRSGKNKSGKYEIHKVTGIDQDGKAFSKTYPSWLNGHSMVAKAVPGKVLVFLMEKNADGFLNAVGVKEPGNEPVQSSTPAAEKAKSAAVVNKSGAEWRTPDQIMRTSALECAVDTMAAQSNAESELILELAGIYTKYIASGEYEIIKFPQEDKDYFDGPDLNADDEDEEVELPD